VIAGRVKSFGGDPSTIAPSPKGTVGEPHHGPGRGWPWGGPGGAGRGDEPIHTGKVGGLHYDRFGDFDGFVLKTEHDSHRFHCREPDIALLVRRAWRNRLRLRVWSLPNEPHMVASIMVLEAPTPFRDRDED